MHSSYDMLRHTYIDIYTERERDTDMYIQISRHIYNMYTYIHMYIRYPHVLMLMYLYRRVCISIQMCVCVDIYTHTQACVVGMRVQMYVWAPEISVWVLKGHACGGLGAWTFQGLVSPLNSSLRVCDLSRPSKWGKASPIHANLHQPYMHIYIYTYIYICTYVYIFIYIHADT